MSLFDDPRAQIERLRALAERQRAADRQVATMTPEQATQMAAFDKWFPWMPKGVMYSLARAGQTALGNPVIEQVAMQALIAKERSAIGLGQKGDLVDEKEPKKKGLFGRIAGYSGKDLLSDIPGVNRAARNTQNLVADNLIMNTAQEHLGGTNPVARGLKAFSRTAGAIGDYPRQVAQGTYRSVSADIQDKGFAGYGRDFLKDTPSRMATGGIGAGLAIDAGMQTELGAAALDWRETGRLNTGSGFFVGGGVKQRQHAAEQTFGTILYPDGSRHARTIGRDLAGLVSEPGSDAYTAISGGADFMVAMGADQATFGGAFSSLRAAKQFKTAGLGPQAIKAAEEGRTMSVRENLIDAMGGIAAPGKRLTVSPEMVRTFLASDGGARFVDRLVNTTSIRTLDRLTGGNWDPASLLAIADETDPDVMRATAERLLTTGRTKDIPKTKLDDYGFRFKEAAPQHIRALQARMPQIGRRARHLRSPRESMTQFVREMDYLDINEDIQDRFLRRFANAPDIDIVDPELHNRATAVHRRAVFDEFDDFMAGEVAKTVGMDDKGAEFVRRLLRREDERVKGATNYWTNEGRAESVFGLIVRKTKRNIGRRQDPHLFDDIVDAEVVEPLALPSAGGRSTTLERTGLLPVVDDTVDAELLDEFDNWEETTEYLQPDVATPMLMNELQSEYMPSPDWRAVKHQLGPMKKLYEHGVEVPISALRNLQSAWKGLVIARPALLVRVMSEIQFAMTLRGASTWINHPLDMMAYVMGDSDAPQMLKRIKARGGSDIRGEAWGGGDAEVAEWTEAQMRWKDKANKSTFYRSANDKQLSNEFLLANKNHTPDTYYAGMADELHTLAKDPISFMVAKTIKDGGTVEDAIDFAWNNMADHRKVLANAHGATDGAKMLTIDGTDFYIRKINERIMQATGDGNPELLDALVTHRLRGQAFDIAGKRNDKLNTTLRDFAHLLPDDMRAPRMADRNHAARFRDGAKDAHGWLLDKMFSNRERTLNRSPEFRQFYFKHAIENARIVDPAEADAFVANLTKAGMKKQDIRRAKYYAERPVDNPLSLREADDLAFAQATDDIQFFLEDMVDKRRLTEALSIISPFGHVIAESMERWAKILSNPSAVAKLQRPIKNAADPELGDVLGMNEDETDPNRRGLRYQDANGEERVFIALSPKLTGLMGDPIPLHGRVQGLNMIGDFTPGVGPGASFPLTALFERFDHPRYDKYRDWIFPFGTPKGGIIERNVMQFVPTWARKMFTDETPQQVIDAMYYKANTGDFNLMGEGATEEEANRLVSEAKDAAFMTKFANALATLISPTAPTPEYFIEGPGGNRIPMLEISKDLQKMRDEDPRNATLNLLDKYGENVFLLLAGKSIGVSPGVLPATVEAEKWIRSDGKGIRGSYKNTYGFFAPQEGDFSFDAYRRLLDNGDRKLNRPEDVPAIANDMVAKARYYAMRAKFENPSDKRSAQILRDFRAKLEKEHPGYDPDGPPGGTLNKASTGALINELERAAKDTKNKTIQNHEAMPALKEYFAFRERLNSIAPAGRGANWWTGNAKDGAKARAGAAQLGDALAQKNIAFAAMWEGALRREFEGGLATDDARNAEGGG